MLKAGIIRYFTIGVHPTKLLKVNVSRCYATATHPAIDSFQQQEMMSHELILVDENDVVVGSDTKLNCHLVKNGTSLLHRAFSVLLFNAKNELVLQQRSRAKAFAAGHVTNACCSHPLYNACDFHEDGIQSTRLAAVKRLIFELGIPSSDVSAADLSFVGRILYRSADADGVWGEHELDYIFVLHKDVKMAPHPMEIEQIWSVPRKEIDEFIRAVQYPVSPWFKLIMQDWLFRIWDNLDNLEKISEKEKIQKYY